MRVGTEKSMDLPGSSRSLEYDTGYAKKWVRDKIRHLTVKQSERENGTKKEYYIFIERLIRHKTWIVNNAKKSAVEIVKCRPRVDGS